MITELLHFWYLKNAHLNKTLILAYANASLTTIRTVQITI